MSGFIWLVVSRILSRFLKCSCFFIMALPLMVDYGVGYFRRFAYLPCYHRARKNLSFALVVTGNIGRMSDDQINEKIHRLIGTNFDIMVYGNVLCGGFG